MKKYTIKDKSGTKKTIYAKDLVHALTFVDSKIEDFDYATSENEADITWNNKLYIGKKVGYNRYAVSKKSGSKYFKWGVYSPKELERLHLIEDSTIEDANISFDKRIKNAVARGKLQGFIFNGLYAMTASKAEFPELKQELEKRKYKDITFSNNPYNTYNVFFKDDVVSNYFYFDLHDLSMSLDNAVNIMKNCGLTIVKIDKRSKEAKVYYRGTSAAEQKAADKLDISLDDSINDAKTKDDVNRPKTFKFFINNRAVSENEYIKHFIEEAANERQSATTAKRVINEDKESAKVNGKNTFMSESGRKFSIVYDSKVKDEANLPTTIQALVNDEEAAIKAYEVAIKNLEGKIDETQMQVLINIMKDERRHVENLYAILNGQVTEKNLEDSIKDSLLGKRVIVIDKDSSYYNYTGTVVDEYGYVIDVKFDKKYHVGIWTTYSKDVKVL